MTLIPTRLAFTGAIIALNAIVSGCANAPMATSGSISEYEPLTPSNGALTQSKLRVSSAEVLEARTVSIVHTSLSKAAVSAKLSEAERNLIANAVDRSMCIGLSDRFEVLGSGQPADLTIHATITQITPTDPSAAGASKVVSAIPSFFSLGFPVPVPRLPVGLGSLSIEAEARNNRGDQKAAMVWARAADSITSTARVSPAGDAYDLASEFGNDFSKLLVTGETPFNGKLSMPTMQHITSQLGGRPKNVACDTFGRTGIINLVAGGLGAPPGWTDKGAAAN